MRLRQIVMVAADLGAAEQQVERQLGVERCYRDPGVAEFGLRNALFRSATSSSRSCPPRSRARRRATDRQTERRRRLHGHGRGRRSRTAAAPGRRPPDTHRVRSRHDGHRRVASAPGGDRRRRSCPSIAPTRGASGRGPDRRGGTTFGTHRVAAVLAVVIEAADPSAMAARLVAVLGCAVVDDRVAFPDGGELRFVPAGDRGDGVTGFAPGRAQRSRSSRLGHDLQLPFRHRLTGPPRSSDREVAGGPNRARSPCRVRRDRSLGDVHLVDLVGAVGEARPAPARVMCASGGVSVEYPSAPCTWIERSITRFTCWRRSASPSTPHP